MKKSVRAVAATATLSAGLGLAGLATAGGAEAQVTPFPNFPCNPGETWNPGNGPYCDVPGPGWGPGGDLGPGPGPGGGPVNGAPGVPGGGGAGGGGHGGGGGGGGGH